MTVAKLSSNGPMKLANDSRFASFVLSSCSLRLKVDS